MRDQMLTTQAADLPDRVQLDEADLRTGIAIAHAVAQAQARLQALADMERVFAAEMQRKYGVDASAYLLLDWITGFEKVQVDNGNKTD